MTLRMGVLAVVACVVSACATDVTGASCMSTEGCREEEEVSMLQAGSWPSVFPAAGLCSRRSLIVGQQVGDETYLQWNAELRANGAAWVEFLNLTERDNKPLRFEKKVEFVKSGVPLYGIVYVRLPGGEPLGNKDAATLKEYIDAGGMLVMGETDVEQVNALMKDLGSTIFEKERPHDDFPCSTPEEAPYLPSSGSSSCPLTKGVTGLQGSNLDEVLDSADSSYPLFHLKSNPGVVVGRAEKRRSLIVIGDDEPFDDDCATRDSDNRLAFGQNTNLQFFKNLFQARCRFWH